MGPDRVAQRNADEPPGTARERSAGLRAGWESTRMLAMGEATTAAAAPVLALKLAVPPPREDELQRERLLAQISDPGVRLCAVVAPAGWGKTRLLAQYANGARTRTAVAWLTLDAGDDDPHRFWSYFLTSVGDATGLGGRRRSTQRIGGARNSRRLPENLAED